MHIPTDILLHIFTYIPNSTFDLSRVCKLFKQILDNRVCNDILIIQNDPLLLIKYLNNVSFDKNILIITKIYSINCLNILVYNIDLAHNKDKFDGVFLHELTIQFCIINDHNMVYLKKIIFHTVHAILSTTSNYEVMSQYINPVLKVSLLNKSFHIANYIIKSFFIRAYVNNKKYYDQEKVNNFVHSIVLQSTRKFVNHDEITIIFSYLLDNNLISDMRLKEIILNSQRVFSFSVKNKENFDELLYILDNIPCIGVV